MRRPVLALALSLLAGVSLVGCRTSPNVAAYVGDERITVDELQQAVDDRRADPEVTAGEDPEYTRDVLTRLVRTEVFDAAAEHFDVSPDPGGLTDLLAALLAGQGTPEDYFAQQADQGYSRADSLERVRQVAILADIAVAQGAADETTEESLRADYAEAVAQRPAQLSVGYINVPDQAAADDAVAALQADPGRYAEVAAANPGQATLAAPQPIAVDDLAGQLGPDLAAQVAQTPPGTAFSTTVDGLTGVLVVLVEESPAPAFEDVRDQLAARALNEAASAGADIVREYADDLGIHVNPRYGEIQGDLLVDGGVAAADGGVVQLAGAGG